MLLCRLSPCNSSRLMALQLDSLVDTSKLEDLFASVLCMSIISSFDHHVLAFISEFVIATASLQLWNSASLCWSFVSKPNSKLSLPVRNLPIKVLFRPDALDFIDDTDASTAWIFANGDSGSTAVMSLNSWYDCFLLLAISHMQKAAQSSENTLLAANADVKCDYALLSIQSAWSVNILLCKFVDQILALRLQCRTTICAQIHTHFSSTNAQQDLLCVSCSSSLNVVTTGYVRTLVAI